MTQPPRSPLALQCPHCAGKFAVPADSTARRFRCPHCQRPVGLPASEPPPVATAPPAVAPSSPPPHTPATAAPTMPLDPIPASRSAAAPVDRPSAASATESKSDATALALRAREAKAREASDRETSEPETGEREARERELAAQEARRARARQLLPPRFTARPYGRDESALDAAAVLIPTPEGGFTPVAADVVRVTHRGREVMLRKTRPSALRTWLSAAIVVACAAVLIAAFFWLLGKRPD